MAKQKLSQANYVLMQVDTFRMLIREEVSAITVSIDPNQQKSSINEPLKTRKEMAKDLDIYLVSLGEWMKKGLSAALYLHKSEKNASLFILVKSDTAIYPDAQPGPPTISYQF